MDAKQIVKEVYERMAMGQPLMAVALIEREIKTHAAPTAPDALREALEGMLNCQLRHDLEKPYGWNITGLNKAAEKGRAALAAPRAAA